MKQPKDEAAVTAAAERIARCAVTPGQIWQHMVTRSKYEIVCLSIDEVRLVVLVTYRSLTRELTWTRDLDVFLGPNEHGNQRFERVDQDPGEKHYAADAKRCSRCGSADVIGQGMGCEIWRYSCSTCGADPA